MTEEEADYWDEYYTKKWLITKANATNKTPADIIGELVREETAVSL